MLIRYSSGTSLQQNKSWGAGLGNGDGCGSFIYLHSLLSFRPPFSPPTPTLPLFLVIYALCSAITDWYWKNTYICWANWKIHYLCGWFINNLPISFTSSYINWKPFLSHPFFLPSIHFLSYFLFLQPHLLTFSFIPHLLSSFFPSTLCFLFSPLFFPSSQKPFPPPSFSSQLFFPSFLLSTLFFPRSQKTLSSSYSSNW